MGQFEELLSSKADAVAIDAAAQSDSLLVAFGGIAAGMGMPPFEFFRLAGELPVKKMFVRDLQQAWYQRGLANVSLDISGTAGYLAGQIDELEVSRTVFVGNSMGGYAAILFGWLLDVDVVHAFAPQTFIGRLSRLLCLDRRWRREMRQLHRSQGLSRSYFDLRPLLSSSNKKTIVHLHFSDQHRLDRIHCRRMSKVPSIVLHPYPYRQHNLIKKLRDDGTLTDLLRQSLTMTQSKAA